MSRHSGGLRLALYALLLAAFALRIHALEAQSIWWDEGISLNLARSPLPAILADRLNNIHPPLYFVLLKGWVALTGLNAFSGRYLSVLASFSQVAAVYAVCRRLFMRRPLPTDGPSQITTYGPLIAAVLVTLSPLSIIYGQEARVYAMLPLASLALLAFAWQVAGRLDTPPRQPPIAIARWFLFGLIAWFSLHLHYVIAFMAAYVSVWLLFIVIRRRRWTDLRRFTFTQVGVGLACLPWFTAVLRNWTAVQAEANAGTYLTDPAPLGFLLKQVWVFHHTGLAGALGRPVVWWLAVLVAVVTAVLYLLRLAAGGSRATAQRLLGQWLIPLAGALIVWTVRSFSHPRYIAFAAIGFIPLAAYLMAPGAAVGRKSLQWAGRTLGLVLWLALLALSCISLYLYFYDPQVAKDDMRGVAGYLQTALTADDLIIVPDAGWAFHFEYEGPTPIVMPQLMDHEGLWARIEAWTQTPRRVAVLSPSTGSRDWASTLPFALEQAGALVEIRPFDGLNLQIYEIDHPATAPAFLPVDARFGALALTGAWVEQGAAADTAVTVALRWHLQDTLPVNHHVVFTLATAAGLPLAQIGEPLVDAAGRPAAQWPAGHVVTTTHVLPIPLGTPPLPLTLRIGIDRLADGTVTAVEAADATGAPQGVFVTLPVMITLAPARQPGSNPYGLPPGLPRLPEPLWVADGLQLTAVGQDRAQASGGQTMLISLEWQVTTPPELDAPPHLQLVLGEQVVADVPLGSHYPPSQWRAGDIVLEHTLLPLPADVAAGTAVLSLEVGGRRMPIGQLQIRASDHTFTPPAAFTPLVAQFGDVARLVGFDLPQSAVTVGEPVAVTLYWQAGDGFSPTAYTVFAHMLAADGRLIGQHDAPPANGERPTTSWVAGEYITDPHLMTFREAGYTGSAAISVGLYDPATGVRLTLADGTDAVMLPVTLTVLPEVTP